MRKITGTIIKIIDDKAAIMTKDCEILYIKKQPGMYLGLEIHFGANEIISSKNKVNMTIKIVSSIAAIFIFVFLNLHFFRNSENYTYVCIDGKASIEFAVDNNMKVVKATSIDKKSQENLMKINLKSKPFQTALSVVLKNKNNIMQDGYTSSDCIIISAYTKHKKDDQSYANKNIEKVLLACKSSVDELDNNVDYRFVGINYDARRLAVKNNISMGRYYIFEKAQEQGKNISLEQARDMQVGELIKKVNIPYLSITNEALTNDEKKIEILKDQNFKQNATNRPAITQEVLPSQNKTNIPNNGESENLPTVIDTKDTHPEKESKKQRNKDEKDSIGLELEVQERNAINVDLKSGENKKVLPTPILPKTNDIKTPPTPIPPKTNDVKVPPTPIPPKTNDIKVPPTPILPKTNDVKVPPTPIPPKTNDVKVPPTPIPPKTNDVKVPPTPIPPKTNDVKVPPTPIPPKTNDVKVPPTPIPPKTNDVKVPPTPIPPKTNDVKVPPTPIPPKTNDVKVPPTSILNGFNQGIFCPHLE
ncbi:anti-sigma factor domain-containing protein [Pseudobacteroides cellulosolvens]|uniref:Anti-sigma factor RsgI, N-terminal n=2 Tax=Pseudobacteroides cellulosolvens TaxID=35825 RepID=A0A0L6JVM1_9FIRM|nr:anti-sigma factor domain-containing protein [Pseudobacteroides cellulosolvens]KNY29878.1 Anti-sigma factor RsgI, N-terminal [Pseudobacteroides cellulosolvens ATCC 35603 = DSM 2933]